MAKSKLNFTKVTTDSVKVKGLLSEDCTTITYEDENECEKEVKVTDLLNAFKNNMIDFSCTLKMQEDMDLIPADEE